MSAPHRHVDDRSEQALLALAATCFTLNFVVLILLESPPPALQRGADQPSHQVLRLYADNDSSRLAADQLRYRLMRPVDESTPAPLVIFLHGSGQRGDDNRRQLQGLPSEMASALFRRRYPCYLLAPQCPFRTSWSNEVEQLAQLVERIITEHAVDDQRVYLTGLSMGGFGSWQLAAHRPNLFAALVPLCGGGDPKTATRLAGVPIWAVHGADDAVIPAQRSRDMVQAVREAGGDPRYTELKGVGHTCWPLAYGEEAGVIAWMFEQHRRQPSVKRAATGLPPTATTLMSRPFHD